MSSQDSDVLSNLHVSLKQASKSPPAVTITVTNNIPGPVTILAWGSPLDEKALQLGLLSLIPEGETAPLEITTIKVSRKMPPTDAALLSLAPGESRENHVELRGMLVPLDRIKGKRVKVKAKGTWMQVWPRARSELTQKMIEELGPDGDAMSGEFETKSIDIEVD
ncbi:unnamed protein product [Discula destructiva]